jgi:nitrogen regulatory protein PII
MEGRLLSLVTAVVKPFAVDAVREALQAMEVPGLTVSAVMGFGRQGGHTETYRGTEYAIDFVPKVKVEVVVPTPMAEAVADKIRLVAGSGRIGDGKIWITEVEQAIRIRTDERGTDAV